ncbi:hypothetical protein MSG28_004947 [Choristoneura fumiferana]|uniref:Uncharacterized protein n=1 Tax=Choristoneura fumiferana TaxID=7141 RepID=A0ACC0JPG5_CHOFU|nr:hypothetical protein MSG28_004947 [Choristoneura fumiferana]
MYCLQWLIPVLLIPKPVNPALVNTHVMFMVLYLIGFFLERKPCTVCSVVFLAAVILICYSGIGNCVFWASQCEADNFQRLGRGAWRAAARQRRQRLLTQHQRQDTRCSEEHVQEECLPVQTFGDLHDDSSINILRGLDHGVVIIAHIITHNLVVFTFNVYYII